MEICTIQNHLEEWGDLDSLITLSVDFIPPVGKDSSSANCSNELVDQLSNYADGWDLLKSGDNIDLTFLDFIDGDLPSQNDHFCVIPGDANSVVNSFLDSSYQNRIVDSSFAYQYDESVLSSSPSSSVSVTSDCSSDYDCIQGSVEAVNLPEELKDVELVKKVLDIYECNKHDVQMWNSVYYVEGSPQYCVNYTPPYSPESILPVNCILQEDSLASQKSVETPPCSPGSNHFTIQDSFATQKFDEHSLSLVSGSSLSFPETKQNTITSDIELQVSSHHLPALKQVPSLESTVNLAEFWGTDYTSEFKSLKHESSQVATKQKKFKSPTLAESRREGKKLSNRNAATKYRMKKRAEVEVLKDEEEVLKKKNKELNERIKQMTTEMSYLRGLMKEMFRARGLIK